MLRKGKKYGWLPVGFHQLTQGNNKKDLVFTVGSAQAKSSN